MHNRLAVLLVAAALTIFGAVSATAGDLDVADPNGVQIIYGVNTAGITDQVPLDLIPNIGNYNGATGSAAYTAFPKAVIVDATVSTPIPVVVNIGVLGGGQVVGFDSAGKVNFPLAADPNNPVPGDAVGIAGFARVNVGTPNNVNTEVFNLSLSLGAPATFGSGPNPVVGGIASIVVQGSGPGWQINPYAVTGLVNSPLLGSQPGGQTVNGEPWTGAGCATFDANDPGCQGTTTVSGSIVTTPNGINVTMVSPTKVQALTTSGALADSISITASVSTLRLKYLPEPGTLLLLGAGAAGLALVGIRRKK